MLDIVVCDVRLGQSILFYPHENPERYSMMVDCGHDEDFHPIDLFINLQAFKKNWSGMYEIGNLVITNYDHDHFDGLPYLLQKAVIKTAYFAKNLSIDELIDIKDEVTPALVSLVDLRSRFTSAVIDFQPSYRTDIFSLTSSELVAAGITPTTNHLSQMIFVEAGKNVICIPGDLEKQSWNLMLQKPSVCNWLKKTNIFFASHHGRENGYHEEVFDYCYPDCIIISDKDVVHGTQQGMSSVYAKHVLGDGVALETTSGVTNRKVLTTRKDGHLHIQLDTQGNARYISPNW